MYRCPICQRLYSNQRSLKIHLPPCRQKLVVEDSHHQIDHHPLRSFHNNVENNETSLNNDDYFCGDCDDNIDYEAIAVNDNDNDNVDSVHGSRFFSDSSFSSNDEFNNSHEFHNDYKEAQQQQSTAASKLQIKLNNLINQHKVPIKLYDDIIYLFNEYISSDNFNKYARLKSRKAFINAYESTYKVTHLKPKHKNVLLTDGTEVTVPVFNAQSMILDLLTNEDTMNEANIAGGYDIFTGNVDETMPENQCYGEIHTGNQWLIARDHYCSNNDNTVNEMPIAMIIFGDKSHTDLHGTLSLTPIIFTLSLFNRAARNTTKFWRPLSYIPNLSYGKNKADKRNTVDKVQDEHLCLSVALESIKEIHRMGGFHATVMGRDVKIKVWIHYFIGDTEGFNKWLGHYPGNKRQVSRPYRDCQCGFEDLNNPNPSCVYVTLEEMRQAKKVLRNNYNEGLALLKSMSRYDIKNALISRSLPLSDIIHGPNICAPPELLHTSGNGLIKYMFESLGDQIGSGKVRDDIDKQHVRMYMIIKRQSERDFPRGAVRNGLLDGTKCQAEERKGNLFLLLCIAHTAEGSNKLQQALGRPSPPQWKKFLEFLKLYLSMEEWFHDCNRKDEVANSRKMIGKVLRMLQDLFPRGDGTNGYCIPKMHAMTKFMFYIQRYGSAMNFFGGPGESAHKFFVKSPSLKTQRRVNEFARQTANQYYDIMVTEYALRSIEQSLEQPFSLLLPNDQTIDNSDNVTVTLSGKYSLIVTNAILQSMQDGNRIYVNWHSDRQDIKKNDNRYGLDSQLVNFILRKLSSMPASAFDNGFCLEGYTRITTKSHKGGKIILYAHPFYLGKEWYDWVYVHFEEFNATGDTVENYYPARILGFVKLNKDIEAVVHCSEKPLTWTDIEDNFIMRTKLGSRADISIVTVPLSSLVHPLCVIPDYGSNSASYIIVLPKRNWSRIFGNKIKT